MVFIVRSARLSLLFPYFSGMKKCIFPVLLIGTLSSIAQPKWQQQVNTRIDVVLDDKKHTLSAYEEFTYTNNSPDTLRFIYIHLWPNAYKNDRTPFAKQLDQNGNTAFYYSKPKNRGYIDSLQFMIDGQSVDYYSVENVPDIARIDLINPLVPGRSITVTTPFKVKLPTVFSRNGHTGQAYYVSQWFPKPAVYDQKGWHPISYLDQGEFYSEFGNYDVTITLPTNYVLMATGNCMDEQEQKRMDSLANAPLPADTLYNNSTPASDFLTKTVHYSEQNIHDFAWFADKRLVVRKDTAYSPGTNQPIITWSAFLPSYSDVWKNANTYLKNAIEHYGKWVGPYPYKTMKAVLGDMKSGGGMEYPTITLIDRTVRGNLKTVIIHEAGHNWFYGMLGSNERDHAWMDEGINTFYEQKTTKATGKDSGKVDVKTKLDESLLYYEQAATDNDQPIDITSAKFTKLNYGLDVYYKTALMLRWMEKYIGEADFEKGMKDYYDTWHHHHPYPEDFRACMQRHTSKSLDWFFDAILNTDKKIDFKITKARASGGATEVTVHNNTGVLSPVLINAYDKDSLMGSAWTQPFTGSAKLTVPTGTWNKLEIDDEIPDGKSTNDLYRRRALFHHFGLKLNPFLGTNRIDKDKLFITPSWGNNQYDGMMLGIALHDLTIPENRFRFAVAPMYAFGSKSFTGTGSIGYLWYPRNIFKEVMLQADGKTFHDDETLHNLTEPLYARYIKVAPSLNFIFNEHNPLCTVTRSLTLKEYNISEENITFIPDTLARPALITKQSVYGLVRYLHSNDRVYNPFNYSLEGQFGEDFAKINLEGNVRIDYNTKNKALYVRGYIGKFFPISSDPAITSRYELNTTYSGADDYLYDGTYRARNATSGLSSQQISVQEGGFKIPVYNRVYRSDNWMATLNLKSDLPIPKIPVRLFFDAGLIPNAQPIANRPGNTTLMYDGGVELYIVKDIVSVYFPLIMSGDFRDNLTNTFGKSNVFARSISFTFQVQNINWLKTPQRLLKSVN